MHLLLVLVSLSLQLPPLLLLLIQQLLPLARLQLLRLPLPLLPQLLLLGERSELVADLQEQAILLPHVLCKGLGPEGVKPSLLLLALVLCQQRPALCSSMLELQQHAEFTMMLAVTFRWK